MTRLIRPLLLVFAGSLLLFVSACSRQQEEGATGPQGRRGDQLGARSLPGGANLNERVKGVLRQYPGWKTDEHVDKADQLKAEGNYAEAEAHYLAALELDPRNLLGRYQLACNYSLWGQTATAVATLRQAVNDGFWGYEMMRDDDDFEAIRNHPDYASLLAEVQRNYHKAQPKQAGTAHLRVPEGAPPAKGWPVLVFLHGYGDSGESYVENAEAAAAHGFAGLAISGPVVQWEKRHAWPSDSFLATHDHLRQILARYRSRKDLDQSRVFLCGFSQGGVHAYGLLATAPDAYAGAIVLSPGGNPPLPRSVKPAAFAKPLCVIHGLREHPGNIALSRDCTNAWKNGGGPILAETHQGKHHFPDDWAERFPRILTWLSDQSVKP